MKPNIESCTKQTHCFFCAMNEVNPLVRRMNLAKCFKEMPLKDDEQHVLVLSSLWNLAMRKPDNPEFPSLGIFLCMSKLIFKGIHHRDWLLKDQNVYIPYYAAHIIGSFTMNNPKFAEKAVNSGVIPPLLELLRGKLSWVEQRVAIRALGHLATHDVSFKKLLDYEGQIVELAMELASTSLKLIYGSFVKKEGKERLRYHCDLLTRGVGGFDVENRKAEEWASQLQCWSLSLLGRFARREKGLNLICNQGFLKDLGKMWGGLVNKKYTCGIGLLRTLCYSKKGRIEVASSQEAILSLCNTSRSSDDLQYMAIESLLLLLKDPKTRYKVIDPIVFYLKDLVESRRLGEAISQVLLQDFAEMKYGGLRLSEKVQRAMQEVWDVRVEKRKRERLMSEDETRERKSMVTLMKKEGNKLFWGGDIEESLVRYTKALDLCLLKYRKERIVLHSNRAQCFLLLKEPENAITDTTKALSLSSNSNPHSKSLWRRSQAYDIMGLAKQSLMDCLLFINCNNSNNSKGRDQIDIPYYASKLISKQISATWLFARVGSTSTAQFHHLEDEPESDNIVSARLRF